MVPRGSGALEMRVWVVPVGKVSRAVDALAGEEDSGTCFGASCRGKEAAGCYTIFF
jgi:hypothetical protein